MRCQKLIWVYLWTSHSFAYSNISMSFFPLEKPLLMTVKKPHICEIHVEHETPQILSQPFQLCRECSYASLNPNEHSVEVNQTTVKATQTCLIVPCGSVKESIANLLRLCPQSVHNHLVSVFPLMLPRNEKSRLNTSALKHLSKSLQKPPQLRIIIFF